MARNSTPPAGAAGLFPVILCDLYVKLWRDNVAYWAQWAQPPWFGRAAALQASEDCLTAWARSWMSFMDARRGLEPTAGDPAVCDEVVAAHLLD